MASMFRGSRIAFLLSVALSLVASPRGHAVPLASATSDASFNVTYRADLDVNNHGLTPEPTSTTRGEFSTFKLHLKGKLAPAFEYSVRYDFVKPSKGKDGLEYANVTWAATPALSFLFGKDRVNSNGWDSKEPTYTRLTTQPYAEMAGKATGQVFQSEVPLMAVKYQICEACKVTLQIFDDVTTGAAAKATRAQFNKASQQPASSLEYQATLGAISPLLQVMTYDINHSRLYTLGIKAKVDALRTTVDYTLDDKGVQISADEKGTTRITTLSWVLDYTLPGVARPFMRAASYNVKDAKNDIKGNVGYDAANASTFETAPFNDNATYFTVGSWCLASGGEHFKPYIAYTAKTGKFLKSAGSDDVENKSEIHWRFGIGGEF